MKGIFVRLAAVMLFAFSISVYANPMDLPVTDIQSIQETPDIAVITGFVHNNTGKPVKTVFITFNLYDHEGNLVGNAKGYASDLAPGERWKFRVPVAAAINRFESFKVVEVKVY